MTKAKVIKEFFEKNGGREVKIQEFKDLTPEDRLELATLSAEALGVCLDADPVKA